MVVPSIAFSEVLDTYSTLSVIFVVCGGGWGWGMGRRGLKETGSAETHFLGICLMRHSVLNIPCTRRNVLCKVILRH